MATPLWCPSADYSHTDNSLRGDSQNKPFNCGLLTLCLPKHLRPQNARAFLHAQCRFSLAISQFPPSLVIALSAIFFALRQTDQTTSQTIGSPTSTRLVKSNTKYEVFQAFRVTVLPITHPPE